MEVVVDLEAAAEDSEAVVEFLEAAEDYFSPSTNVSF